MLPALQSASASHAHAPCWHVNPAAQTAPQAPQLAESLAKFLQPAGALQHV